MTLDRRVTPARADLAAARLRGQVEAARFCEPTPMEIAAGVTALRREPRHDAGLETQALRGQGVDIYEVTDEGWAWGQLLADGYVGWIAAEALAHADPAPLTHRVVAPRTFVYPAPDMKTAVLAALPLGAGVRVTQSAGGFVFIAPYGYVFAAHLAAWDQPALDYVSVAEQFLHVPYLWGGKTSEGLDCSGLVQTTLAAAGVDAPRDADMQERALGRAIAHDVPLERGDLVFWRGHVGIMRDAQTLLHANAHAMSVTSEPLAGAQARIAAAGGGEITGIRRL